MAFPRARDAGAQESSYDLRVEGNVSLGEQGKRDPESRLLLSSDGSAGGYNQGYQYGSDQQQPQQDDYLEVTAQPAEATIGRGETVNITCLVKGAQQYTVKWGKYAHDTTLPAYARVRIESRHTAFPRMSLLFFFR